jgi:hypothetical protein
MRKGALGAPGARPHGEPSSRDGEVARPAHPQQLRSLPASHPRVGRCTRGDLQGPEVWFAEVDDLPAADMAELCHEHTNCIKGFKATATGDLAPLAGWWHFLWDQDNMQWNITDPTGENGYVVVQSVDASFPPAALINAAPGIVLQPIVSIIEEEGLFPPIRRS